MKIISFQDMFMNLSYIISKRSKDPNTQVGATIVFNNKIIGMGYNGFPNTNNDFNNDKIYPWSKDTIDNKYLYVVHAELNAILNSSNIPYGSILYTTLYPCNECAKAIIQAGIKTIYYVDNYNCKIKHDATKKMFLHSGIKTFKMTLSNDPIKYHSINYGNINKYKYLFYLMTFLLIILIMFIYSL